VKTKSDEGDAMKKMHRGAHLIALMLATSIATAPALAQPPWAGGGKGHGGESQQEHKSNPSTDDSAHGKGNGKSKGGKPQTGLYFSDHSRDAVHKYYASAGHDGKACPPGLAKKNNGCMPPGQAKKWQVGHPLPTTVVTYAVPHQVLISLPPVPVGHKYVQVAGDVLLIAVGSMMVVDGINGLSGR
jgi:Ni/Co efflux regulator RcnB